MGVEDAARAGKACGAKILIPIHWGEAHGNADDIARLAELFPGTVGVLERQG
jgi:L-ascorbate metabolism protein UlaG (beta-lactamase superfamily)